MKTVEYTATNLLLMSPLSVAFKDGKIYLVSRELIAPANAMMELAGGSVVFAKFKVRLKHYPITISEAGQWSYDKHWSYWEAEY